MSDTQKKKTPEKRDEAQDSSRPEKPPGKPQDRDTPEAPRRMRWPADFPAKH
ncbi:hypothetical protein [Achromobacter piechaudii]|uniref:hypothetical protein n=1 Tax=Achromobacter piechaudii TaxID=72556 RepID=UPI003DAA2694